MNLTHNGLTFQVEDSEIVRLVLARFHNPAPPLQQLFGATPAIGEYWADQGGIYAGIAHGRDGKSDYHLILGPEFDGTTNWDVAVKWASEVVVDGRNDFALPTRKEQALLFANVSENFKAEVYWSSEQHASGSVYAWGQGFGYGGQSHWTKDSHYRARAVRRLAI